MEKKGNNLIGLNNSSQNREDHLCQICLILNHIGELSLCHIKFRCNCTTGYIMADKTCRPVCTEPCVHGTCVRPEECDCEFGYVGDQCQLKCNCNGNSQCQVKVTSYCWFGSFLSTTLRVLRVLVVFYNNFLRKEYFFLYIFGMVLKSRVYTRIIIY